MLHKRDPIFWTATAIFVVAVALALTVDDSFMLLAVASYLLRPTLHSLGFFRKLVDERQLHIQFQASNVGFAALVIGNIGVTLYLMGKGDHTWELVNAVMLAGLVVRALSGLLLVGDPAAAGPRIVMAVGCFFMLFGLLEGAASGAISHGLPGLFVIGLGLGARKAPRAIAAVLFVLAAALVVLVVTTAYRRQNLNWGTGFTALIIGVPLLTAAFCILRGAAERNDDVLPPTTAGAVP